jgi:hypothetical protein
VPAAETAPALHPCNNNLPPQSAPVFVSSTTSLQPRLRLPPLTIPGEQVPLIIHARDVLRMHMSRLILRLSVYHSAQTHINFPCAPSPSRNTTSGFPTPSPPNAPRNGQHNSLNRPPHETRGAVAVSRLDSRPTSFFRFYGFFKLSTLNSGLSTCRPDSHAPRIGRLG